MPLFNRRARHVTPAGESHDAISPLRHASQYRGQANVAIDATQFGGRDDPSDSDRRRTLAEWIEFLSVAKPRLEGIDLVCRVPQELFAAVGGQPQLRSLAVKWGPYHELAPICGLERLDALHVGGATAVESLDPLVGLSSVTTLSVSQAYGVEAPDALGQLANLRSLTYGNASLGSDRSVPVPDLRWLPTLQKLRHLNLPGIRLVDADLSPILELPVLETLNLPLRRSYRKQVFELASTHQVFAEMANRYVGLDKIRPGRN